MMVLMIHYVSVFGLVCFVEHNAELLDKCTFDSLWNELAAKLNDIGQPDHTTAEWKRIWSVHKYNRKKRRIAEIDNQDTEQDDRLGILMMRLYV